MLATAYQTVFDVRHQPLLDWKYAVTPLLILAAGLVLLLMARRPGRRISPYRMVFAKCWIAFVVIFGIGAAAYLLVTRYNFVKALAEGRVEIVEGNVSAFHPMPSSGHDLEWFEVNGRRFSYSDFVITGAFNNTASHGGPIHPGLAVRLHALDGNILRLEIAK